MWWWMCDVVGLVLAVCVLPLLLLPSIKRLLCKGAVSAHLHTPCADHCLHHMDSGSRVDVAVSCLCATDSCSSSHVVWERSGKKSAEGTGRHVDLRYRYETCAFSSCMLFSCSVWSYCIIVLMFAGDWHELDSCALSEWWLSGQLLFPVAMLPLCLGAFIVVQVILLPNYDVDGVVTGRAATPFEHLLWIRSSQILSIV